jgi:hypothetical protein
MMKKTALALGLFLFLVFTLHNCNRNFSLDEAIPTTPTVVKTTKEKELNTNVLVIFANEKYLNTAGPIVTGPWVTEWDPNLPIGTITTRKGDANEGTSYIRYKADFTWVGWYVNRSTPTNLSKFATGSLILYLRNATSTNVLSINVWGGTAVTAASRGFVSDGTWQRLKIPMSAFGANWANPNNVYIVITGNTAPNKYFDVDSIIYTNN